MAGWTNDGNGGRIGKAAILELTLDAMEQGISVVDADLNVVVFNRRFLDILGLPTGRFQPGDPFEEFIRFNAERGDYGPGVIEEQVQARLALARSPAPHCFERIRPDGTVIEIRGTPIPAGGFLTTYTDVTERRQTEKKALMEALDAAHAQLHATLETVSAGIGLFDRDDRLVLFNSHYREVYPGLADVIERGSTFEQILRTAADRGIVAEAVGRRQSWYQERVQRHRHPGGPFQQKQADGRWVQIDERRTADGGIVAVFTDVSELKRREEELAAALRDKDALLAEFNTVLDTIEYGVLFLGPDLRMRLANRAFSEMWHFPHELVSGHAEMLELMRFVASQGMYPVPASELEDYFERRLAALRQGDIPPTDLRVTDGRVFEYQCKSLPDGGRMLTYFDITAYRRVEEALKESEQRFRDFASSSSDWVWEMGPDLLFSFASERMLSVFHIAPEDVIGKTREEVGRGSLDKEAWDRHLDDLRAHRPFKNFRYGITSGSGEQRWITTSGLPLFADDGTFRGYRGTSSDITEEMRREYELKAAKERAERALAELKQAQTNLVHAEKLALLGQLVAGIAHEIKNPLNFVNNFAGLSIELLDEMRDELASWLAGRDPDQRAQIEDLFATLASNLGKIREHGSRADGIVKSMLAHSREGPGEKRPIDINALVEESLGLAYHGARAQDSAFNATLERSLDPAAGMIDVVPQDLSRVLLNLFANGFYAMQERMQRKAGPGYRPALHVATRRLDGAVEIRVRDNGVGIAAPVLEKIFTPFYTTKPAGQGTGLGLSLSYDIVVHQHGGVFEVDTRAGEYAEFVVRLPCRPRDQLAAAAPR
ncbi:MAG: PAS-domain containing protein [Defluviicoccus sp.]|nr:PAS-domain containing protein [Defluviicoccus sp.]MDG4592911.1 PAS-domain containing protein [Defluviicoccus sp.]MDS4073351.1 PAS-domain containing protein [Defluviicoccus sp.]